MPITENFKTNALYPGHTGQCRVITHDPFPDGIPDFHPREDEFRNLFKITIPHKTFMDYVWNLEEWDVTMSSDLLTTHVLYEPDGSETTFEKQLDADANGQFHFLDYYLSYVFPRTDNYTARVLKGEPYERVCGRHYQTVRTQTEDPNNFYEALPPEYEHLEVGRTLLFPEFTILFQGDPFVIEGSTFSDFIKTPDEEVVGNFSASIQKIWAPSSYTYFRVYLARVKGEEVDLYLDIQSRDGLANYYDPLFPGGYVLSNSDTHIAFEAMVFGVDYWISPVTFTVFGETVDGYLHYSRDNFEEAGPVTLNNFALNIDLLATELYTY